MAISSFCSTLMEAPGDCSPSLSVVSKIIDPVHRVTPFIFSRFRATPRRAPRRLSASFHRDDPAPRNLHDAVGLQQREKSSIFSGEPVSSTDMVSWPTSITCALNTSATWKISPRCGPWAFTLISMSSRFSDGHAGELGDLDHVDRAG